MARSAKETEEKAEQACFALVRQDQEPTVEAVMETIGIQSPEVLRRVKRFKMNALRAFGAAEHDNQQLTDDLTPSAHAPRKRRRRSQC